MSLGPAIDTAIGLSLIFLLMGLIVSGLQEVIAGILQTRGDELFKAITKLLNDFDVKPVKGGLFQNATDHPLFFKNLQDKLPSYVPGKNFALAVLDMLRESLASSPAPTATPAPAPSPSPAPAPAPAPAIGFAAMPSLNQFAAAVSAMPNGDTKRALNALLVNSKDVDSFRAGLETWFDDAMDRVSGMYKRWATANMFVFGLAIAIFLNVDALRFADALWKDEALRNATVEIARRAANDLHDSPAVQPPPAPSGGADGTAAPTPPPAPSPAANSTDPGVPAATSLKPRSDSNAPAVQPKTAQTVVQESKSEIDAAYRILTDLPVPIGWEGFQYTGFAALLWMIAGWIITGFAASKGAPFWFSALEGLLRLRNSGPKPAREDKKPKQ